jgi:chorismate mutase
MFTSAVAEVKKTAKYSSSFYRPEREAQVLRTILDLFNISIIFTFSSASMVEI